MNGREELINFLKWKVKKDRKSAEFTDKAREDLNKRVKIWAIIIIAVIFGELILLGII